MLRDLVTLQVAIRAKKSPIVVAVKDGSANQATIYKELQDAGYTKSKTLAVDEAQPYFPEGGLPNEQGDTVTEWSL